MIAKKYYPEGYLSGMAKNRAALINISTVQDAAEKGEILEADAFVCDCDHNLIVNLGCMRGIVPREEGAVGISEGEVRDIALISRVGKPICFTVEEIRTDSSGVPFAVLSRRRAQEMCRKEYLQKLVPGDIINAKVTHLENFGAFCDIGCGISALLPIDSISVSRIAHPRDRFLCGANIKAAVRSVDERGRITLTLKELLGTWEENAAQFAQGETVGGIIRSVEDYGVFIELTPNLAGLAEPRSDVKVGQSAGVYIKSLLPEKLKVKLIIVDAFDRSEPPAPLKYYQTDSHIDRWVYSPPGANRVVETVF